MNYIFTRIISFVTISLCTVFASSAFAQTATFIANQDYTVLSSAGTPTTYKQPEVVEYFSYGCPHCYTFDPYLEKWIAAHQKQINFKRVPVVFNPTWLPLAKAYYIAQALGVENKVTPDIFTALHVKGQDLTDPKALAKIFVSHGVKEKQFMDAYQYSPTIDIQVQESGSLMKRDSINEVPSVVVNQKYRVNMEQAKEPKRFIATLDYLVKLANKKT